MGRGRRVRVYVVQAEVRRVHVKDEGGYPGGRSWSY